jgi:hypothetical protein
VKNCAAYNTSINPAAPKRPAIGAAVLMAPPVLVPELPAPPVEEAPVEEAPVEEAPVSLPVEEDSVADDDSLPVEEDSVADDDSLPVEEDSVADDDSLPVEEDASELAVDEASLPEEVPVSWAEEPPPVMLPRALVTPPRALLTSPPAAEVISPTILGGMSGYCFVGVW